LRKIPAKLLKKRFRQAGIMTKYYTPRVHKAAFALPAFIRDTVRQARAAA
jgi:spermidine synthase